MRRLAALVVIAACGHPDAARPVPPPGPGSASGSAEVVVAPPAAPVDAPEPPPPDEERLAAIQKAMNELDEAVQGCWAASAVERFDIAGELVARIDIAAGGARVELARDTLQNPRLAACVSQLLTRYLWAPPLHGQAIQMPFRFRAPDGQSVIDRAMVPWIGQARVAVAVLLDEANTGSAAASMFELALEAGATTGARWADRGELWYFLGPATVQGYAGAKRATVAAGDMMYVPAGGAREVIASAGAVHAVIVAVPGGREGAARAGALPTREVTGVRAAPVAPIVLPAAAAKTYQRPPPPPGPGKPPVAASSVKIFAEPATIKDKALAASILEMPAGANVPEHVHAGETELLYLLAGSGTMTVAGVALPVTATSVVQIPPNTPHSFTAAANVRAVQIYTPAGPEQRFKAKP